MEKKQDFTVIANWKMNKTQSLAEEYMKELKPLVQEAKSHVWLAVPFTAISKVKEQTEGSNIQVGAQNMNDATAGAFTGEVAAIMIKEAGASFVLLGHSERRQYFHESDEFINKKIHRAFESGIIPVLCIGENFDEREAHKTEEVLTRELTSCLANVSQDQAGSLLIAYEPIWAIGTGKSATPELVQETHALIKKVLKTLFHEDIRIPVLYGGSVNPSSCQALEELDAVDGFLVGGASLDPETFAKIVKISDNV